MKFKEGQTVKGKVKQILPFGAFIDLGDGIEGLLTIVDITWRPIQHPSEVLSVGQIIEPEVLTILKSGQVQLGLKQKTENPWKNAAQKYPKGTKVRGKVKTIKEFGVWVELEDFDALAHINYNPITPGSFNVGDIVEAEVLEIVPEKYCFRLGNLTLV